MRFFEANPYNLAAACLCVFVDWWGVSLWLICFCEIVVGPGLKQSKTIDSIKYFLGKNQMSYLVNKVHASDIPYIET